mmetsp:Transcript_101035/g.253352  ORF Transcript_101035/g.253352 Transcript_101035/m.253352 type:complete len:233 (+) Transcript_101035:240-938(+)
MDARRPRTTMLQCRRHHPSTGCRRFRCRGCRWTLLAPRTWGMLWIRLCSHRRGNDPVLLLLPPPLLQHALPSSRNRHLAHLLRLPPHWRCPCRWRRPRRHRQRRSASHGQHRQWRRQRHHTGLRSGCSHQGCRGARLFLTRRRPWTTPPPAAPWARPARRGSGSGIPHRRRRGHLSAAAPPQTTSLALLGVSRVTRTKGASSASSATSPLSAEGSSPRCTGLGTASTSASMR